MRVSGNWEQFVFGLIMGTIRASLRVIPCPYMQPWTRRAFIGTLPVILVGETVPTELRRFKDGATEFDVNRLTDPAHTSYLPPAHLHPISRHSNSVLYCSDRSGVMQAYRMDLKNGEGTLVQHLDQPDSTTLAHTPDEHNVCCFDGRNLVQAGITKPLRRDIYEIPGGSDRGKGFGFAEDGLFATFVETDGSSWRLRIIGVARPSQATIAEAKEEISDPMPRPRRSGVLFRQHDGLWLVNYDGADRRRLKLTAGGVIGPAMWSPDGRTVFYLFYPDDHTKLHQLREHTPDSNDDKLIAPTSQFVSFAPNSDGSVFVGVSSNKASPHILLLLRVTRRELTMCEHHSADAPSVRIAFSPNSQRLVFQTDREGKPTLYAIAVERFVEKTESS
jgi:oligogalacturonide lyase